MSKTIILIKNQENITVTTYIELKENETNPDEQNCNTNQKSRKFQENFKKIPKIHKNDKRVSKDLQTRGI